jgi:hypothetical protein
VVDIACTSTASASATSLPVRRPDLLLASVLGGVSTDWTAAVAFRRRSLSAAPHCRRFQQLVHLLVVVEAAAAPAALLPLLVLVLVPVQRRPLTMASTWLRARQVRHRLCL